MRLPPCGVLQGSYCGTLFAPQELENRAIALVQGRAHFDVERDPERAFQVAASDVIIEVTGTNFDVDLSGDQTMVEVFHGSVTVGRPTKEQIALSAGQSAIFGSGGVLIELGEAQKNRWRERRLRVRNETLSAIIEEVERYIPGKILVLDDTLAGQRITGSFSIEDPVSALENIAAVASAEVIGHPSAVLLIR